MEETADRGTGPVDALSLGSALAPEEGEALTEELRSWRSKCRICGEETIPLSCKSLRNDLAWPLSLTCGPCSTYQSLELERSLPLVNPHDRDFSMMTRVFNTSLMRNGRPAPRLTLEYTSAASECSLSHCKDQTNIYLTDCDGDLHYMCLDHVIGGTQRQVREVYQFISEVNHLFAKGTCGDSQIVSKGRQLLLEAVVRSLPTERKDDDALLREIGRQIHKEWFRVNPHQEYQQTRGRLIDPTFLPWWKDVLRSWGSELSEEISWDEVPTKV